MSTYLITSRAGVIFGKYQGATPEAAWAAMVAEGGAGAEGTIEDWIVTEVVESPAQVARERDALLAVVRAIVDCDLSTVPWEGNERLLGAIADGHDLLARAGA